MRCKAGIACIGFHEAKTGNEALGTCHMATAAYVPSYPLRFAFAVRLRTLHYSLRRVHCILMAFLC